MTWSPQTPVAAVPPRPAPCDVLMPPGLVGPPPGLETPGILGAEPREAARGRWVKG